MSAARFFSDRDAIRSAATLAFKGLVDHSTVVDRMNTAHDDNLFAVKAIYDNGCPEDYNEQLIGVFRSHDDAAYVMQCERKDHDERWPNDEDWSVFIEIMRVY